MSACPYGQLNVILEFLGGLGRVYHQVVELFIVREAVNRAVENQSYQHVTLVDVSGGELPFNSVEGRFKLRITEGYNI